MEFEYLTAGNIDDTRVGARERKASHSRWTGSRFGISWLTVVTCTVGVCIVVLLSVLLWYVHKLSIAVDKLKYTQCAAIISPTTGSVQHYHLDLNDLGTSGAQLTAEDSSEVRTSGAPPTTENICPSSLNLRYLGRCYKVQITPRNHTDATSVCGGLHPSAHLLDVNSAGEQEQVEQWAGLDGLSDIWTSGIRSAPGSSVFVWENSDNIFGYSNWLAGEPNNSGNENCVHIWKDRSWQWNDKKCSTKYPFICEYP